MATLTCEKHENLAPVIRENIITKILFAYCSEKISYCENLQVYGIPREWHSNIFCTPIFVIGQDESQGTTTEMVDGQNLNCLLARQESTSHFT